jgi:hypothetical protein
MSIDNITELSINIIDECIICLGEYVNPYTLSCEHIFCNNCIIDSINKNNRLCPLCRNIINAEDLLQLNIPDIIDNVNYIYRNAAIESVLNYEPLNYYKICNYICIYTLLILIGLILSSYK